MSCSPFLLYSWWKLEDEIPPRNYNVKNPLLILIECNFFHTIGNHCFLKNLNLLGCSEGLEVDQPWQPWEFMELWKRCCISWDA